MNKRVLVADDNPAIHEDYRKALAGGEAASVHLAQAAALEAEIFGDVQPAPEAQESAPYPIDSAFQGAEAVELVRAGQGAGHVYAVGFIDMRMPPGLDGLETIRRIWEVDPRMQIVICTAYSDYTWQETIRSLGNSDKLLILKKPFDPVEVWQLAHALSKKWDLVELLRKQIATMEATISARTAELEQLNGRLLEMSRRDPLTNLANRRSLTEYLQEHAHACTRSRSHLGVLVVDVDHFKLFNDSLGHPAGDACLQQVAAALAESSRQFQDLLARYGGEEFILVVPHIAPEQLAALAERLRLAVATLNVTHPRAPKGHVTVSVGAACAVPDATMTPDVLVKRADEALYRAKQQGRDRVVVDAL